jgi:hypothetical protein
MERAADEVVEGLVYGIVIVLLRVTTLAAAYVPFPA